MYDTHKKFGAETKTFSMGVKREVKIEKTAGPGQYEVERATSATKQRLRGGIMSKSAKKIDFASKEHADSSAPG